MNSDIVEIEASIKEKKQEFLKSFIVLFSLIMLFYAIVFYRLNVKPEFYLNVVAIAAFTYFYFFLTRNKYDFDTIFNLGLLANTGLIYVKILFFWEAIPLVFLWFLSIPAATIILNSFSKTIFWTFIIVVLSVSAPVVSDYLNLKTNIVFTQNQLLFINLSAFVLEVAYITFFIYYNRIFNKLHNKLQLIQAINEHQSILHTEQNIPVVSNTEEAPTAEKNSKKQPQVNDEKYEKLLRDIDKYFKEKEPYRDPDFTINKLAIDLNTNVSYVSRAFNQSKEQNFKTYINTYRVKRVKERLNNKEHEKYTLKHIYQEAGFIHQPTFNRVFKEVEGITPSEYIGNIH